MHKRELARERRKQSRLDQLGTDRPICSHCLESDWRCLELHHLSENQTTEDCSIECRNCHRKLSDDQKDHPSIDKNHAPSMIERIGYYLLGLADFFRLLVDSLTQFGHLLIDYARHSISPNPTSILE